MKIISLGLIVLSTLSIADFNRGNGVVTDNDTKLQWQDNYSDNNGKIKIDIWKNAIDYCQNLTLNSHSDWRLPNIKELTSLVSDTEYAPAINKIFQNSYSLSYLSSTTHASDSFVAWHVNFNHGIQYTKGKAFNDGYVRCVRTH